MHYSKVAMALKKYLRLEVDSRHWSRPFIHSFKKIKVKFIYVMKIIQN